MISYRRRDPSIYLSSPEVCELSDLTTGGDAAWFTELIRNCDIQSPAKDDRSFVRNCLSAPLRVAGRGTRILVMLDDIHECASLADSSMLVSELVNIFSRNNIAFVVSGRRRFAVPGLALRKLELDDLNGTAAHDLVKQFADSLGVLINDQTRDLIAAQTSGRVGPIRSLFTAARDARRQLETFQHVEQIYTEAVLKGGLGSFYLSVLDEASGSNRTRRELIRLLNNGLSSGAARSQLDGWERALKIDAEEFDRTVAVLDNAEFISLDGSIVRVDNENHILADTIRSRYRIECENDPRAVVAGEILAGALKRAPRMMARLYKRVASVGLSEILSAFDCQEVPTAMLDYGRFRTDLKGASQDEINARLSEATDRTMLPQMVHTAAAAEYYSELSSVIEPERAVVAIGFNDQNYTDSSQVVWIAAEIDSKL